MKYDITGYTPLERQLLRRQLDEKNVVFTIENGILHVNNDDEVSVDETIEMIDNIANAIAEEIEMDTQARRGDHHGQRCDNCLATPAARINLRREVGMLLVSSTYSVNPMLCDTCAQVLTNEMQKQTALKGWTSPASLVMNPFVIAGNARNRRKHRRQLGG